MVSPAACTICSVWAVFTYESHQSTFTPRTWGLTERTTCPTSPVPAAGITRVSRGSIRKDAATNPDRRPVFWVRRDRKRFANMVCVTSRLSRTARSAAGGPRRRELCDDGTPPGLRQRLVSETRLYQYPSVASARQSNARNCLRTISSTGGPNSSWNQTIFIDEQSASRSRAEAIDSKVARLAIGGTLAGSSKSPSLNHLLLGTPSGTSGGVKRWGAPPIQSFSAAYSRVRWMSSALSYRVGSPSITWPG